jgi:hypothetical protein
MDEMSSPVTASPSGLIFMTLALSFVGEFGSVGGVLVFVASFLHLVLVVWFTYMSLAYQTMPGEVYRVAHIPIILQCSFFSSSCICCYDAYFDKFRSKVRHRVAHISLSSTVFIFVSCI